MTRALSGLALLLAAWAAGFATAGPLDALLGADPQPLLAPEQAFAARLTAEDPRRLVLEWNVAPGYYLYRERMQVEVLDGAAAVHAALPAGEAVMDEALGPVQVYRGTVRIPLTLVPAGAATTLRVRYQGCAQGRLCYAPAERTLRVGDS